MTTVSGGNPTSHVAAYGNRCGSPITAVAAVAAVAVASLIEVPESVVANLSIDTITGPATRAALTTVSGVGARSQVAA